MKKITIGLIGCGKIVDVHHTPALLEMPGKAKITALFDLNTKAAKALSKKHKLDATLYDSVDELLKNVDSVIISTPNISHYPLSMQALKAKVHVLVEKPIAVSMREANTMIATAKKQKRILQVNQTLRFTPLFCAIKNVIDSGVIGKVQHFRCLRASATSPDKGWSPGASWFVKKAARGGLVMDIAVHMADFMGWCCGEGEKVYSTVRHHTKGIEVPDNVTTLIDFKSGATGVLELSWTIPVGGGLIEIYGTKGTIRNGFSDTGAQILLPGKKPKIIKPKKVANSHRVFVDAINGKAPSTVPGEVGRHALAYCLAIEKSGEIKKPVKL